VAKINATGSSDTAGGYEPDPVFVRSRREALVILCFWLAGLLWVVTFCYLTGYPERFDPETFRTVWGIPAWLFWGLVVPWLVADGFTVWFCFWYMKDADLPGSGQADEVIGTGQPPASGEEGCL